MVLSKEIGNQKSISWLKDDVMEGKLSNNSIEKRGRILYKLDCHKAIQWAHKVHTKLSEL